MCGKPKVVLIGFLLIPFLGGCAQINKLSKTTKGAALGGLGGAAAGGIVGSQVGHPVAGAAIGGTLGAVGGGLAGRSLEQRDQALAEQRARLEQQRQEIDRNQALIEELKRSDVEARETGRGVTINLPNVIFGFNSAELTPDGGGKVEQIANILNRQGAGRRVSVEGHASRERADQEAYNQRLSEKRAQKVADALTRAGVSRERTAARGYGTRFPVAPNETEEGRRKNRRVEVIIEN